MNKSAFIFNISLDVFIVFTIFSIYFYILIKFFLHHFEEYTITYFFKNNLKYYDYIISSYKKSKYYKLYPNFIPNAINKKIKKTNEKPITTDYKLTDIIVSTTIISFGLLLSIYFLFDRKNIMEHINLNNILFTIIINLVLIVSFECMFIFFVYGNTNLINIGHILGLQIKN